MQIGRLALHYGCFWQQQQQQALQLPVALYPTHAASLSGLLTLFGRCTGVVMRNGNGIGKGMSVTGVILAQTDAGNLLPDWVQTSVQSGHADIRKEGRLQPDLL